MRVVVVVLLALAVAACAAPPAKKTAPGTWSVCAVQPIGKTDSGLVALRMYCEADEVAK